MTADEHAKVDQLARRLFPDDVPRHDQSNCSNGKRCAYCKAEKSLWNSRLWDTYNALIEVRLI